MPYYTKLGQLPAKRHIQCFNLQFHRSMLNRIAVGIAFDEYGAGDDK